MKLTRYLLGLLGAFLIWAALGFYAAAPASAATCLDTGVGPGAIAYTSGTNCYIMKVNADGSISAGANFQLSPTITVQNAAYSAGNSLGGLITVTGAARFAGGGGVLDAINLRSAGGATNTIWVYAWSKLPAATCTDKAAYVGSASDLAYVLPGYPTSVILGGAPGAWDTGTSAATTGNVSVSNFKNQDTTPGTAIYVCLVTAGSVTPATTSDLSIVLGGVQD